jgi:hypothetical protein
MLSLAAALCATGLALDESPADAIPIDHPIVEPAPQPTCLKVMGIVKCIQR